MVIAVDLDECVFNYIDPFLTFVNSLYGTAHTRKDVTSYSFEDSGTIPIGSNSQLCKEFGDSTGLLHLPLMPGAQEAIRQLRQKHRVFYITSRSSDFYQDTEEALVREDIWSPTLFSTKAMPKAKIVRAINAVAFIDDSPRFINEVFENTGSKAILLSNIRGSIEACKSPFRARSWEEVLEYI